MTQEGSPKRLKAECDRVLADPALLPTEAETFCNIGVVSILRGLGVEICPGKPPPLANEIYDLLSRSQGWAKIRPEMAHGFALSGCIVVAAKKDLPHGHVAVLYPTQEIVTSGKWGKQVPVCCNIGTRNAIMGVNFAFRSEPDYFLYSA